MAPEIFTVLDANKPCDALLALMPKLAILTLVYTVNLQTVIGRNNESTLWNIYCSRINVSGLCLSYDSIEALQGYGKWAKKVWTSSVAHEIISSLFLENVISRN